MRLTKKHIGQLFDNHGADGSWCYQLVDVKGKELLFYTSGRYEIDSNKYADWRLFKPVKFSKEWIDLGWQTGRRTK